MRSPYLLIFSRFRSFLLFLLGVFALHFSAHAQCYQDVYVYQISPYGSICGAQDVTLQADYYDPYGSGEFRWYTNEYDYYPVYTEPYSYYLGTSYYTFWVSAQTTVWVSYYDYNTNCESYRVPYTVEVSSPPADGNIYASSTTISLGQSVTISSDGGNGWPHFWCSNDGGQTWSIFSDEHVGEYSFQHTPTATGTYRYHLRNSTDCGFCWEQPGGCPSYVYVDVTVVTPPVVSKGIFKTYIYAHNNVIVSSVVNANTDQVAFTSFESSDKGYWTYTGVPGGSANDKGRTGKKYYLLSAGNIVRDSLLEGKYIISYWSQGGSAAIGGSNLIMISTISNRTINGWTYYEHIVSIQNTGTAITLSGAIKLDELRLYPVDAQMSTITYDSVVGKTSETDLNNMTTFYEYDEFNRLKCLKDQYGNIREHYIYHYKNQL